MTKPNLASAALAVLAAAALAACTPAAPAKPPVDTGKIADAVKADAQQLVTDFNGHDAAKAASQDAPDEVGMFHGTANTVGPDADQAAMKQIFADSSNAKVTTANETVDVAASGDMAVYRSTYTYVFNDPKTKKPTTEDGNWIMGFKQQADGSWKIEWSVVSDTGPAPAAAAAPPAKS